MTIALKEEAARRKQCASALAAETLCLLVALEVLPLAVIAQYIAAAGGGFGHFGPWRSQNMLRKVTQSGACDRSAERVLFAHLLVLLNEFYSLICTDKAGAGLRGGKGGNATIRRASRSRFENAAEWKTWMK
jgi:hypothetical protein